MLLKRISALILALALCLTAAGCFVDKTYDDWNYTPKKPLENTDVSVGEEEYEDSQISPTLYKVTDASGHVLWLFGTIHVGRTDFYPLPGYVLKALDESDTLALEVNLNTWNQDKAARTEAVRLMKYKDGSQVTDYISKELYDEAVSVLTQAGNYDPALINYMPILWYNYVQSACYSKEQVSRSLGVDQHLLNQAYRLGKDIVEIESGKFQYSMMASFSTELQILLLESVLQMFHNETAAQSAGRLMDLWAQGDPDALAAELAESDLFNTPEHQALYEEYINTMFTQRNDVMTKYAEYSLTSGKEVFICVGAGHVVGQDGIASRLEKLGYTVQIITE